ncbi:MAG: hypothetical protein ACREGE_02050 [Candidatus Microsaccharimonas sp.]
MINPEFGPELPQVGFLDMTRQLAEDDTLIVSRNKVRHFRGGQQIDQALVHYEALNYLSDIYRPISPGKLVTEEFRAAARAMAAESDTTPWSTYPLLTVIHHATGKYATQKVDVAKLIADDRLQVYSIPARSTVRGEMLSLGFDGLIKNLAQVVEVNPVGMVVVEDGGAHTVDETGLYSRTHLPAQSEMTFDRRGPSALSLMQMSAAQTFIENRHRVTENADGRVEVVVRVMPQPDLQTLMLELIDMVESRDMRLEYKLDGIATGEIGSVFSVVNQNGELLLSLSAERTLDMAVLNAYLAAAVTFPEL